MSAKIRIFLVFGLPKCKTTPFLHLAWRFRPSQVQNHPVFAPGPTFSAFPSAKPPCFCTWVYVFGPPKCKTTTFLHLGLRFRPSQVQNHPVFAPDLAFSALPSAKPPSFCTWPGVFGPPKCKTTPFLHLAWRFWPSQVQNHPVFALGLAAERGKTLYLC